MGSSEAAVSTLPKINSETNLAVQLLLAVSDGRRQFSVKSSTPSDANKVANGGSPSDDRSSNRSTMSDEPRSDPSSSGATVATFPKGIPQVAFVEVPKPIPKCMSTLVPTPRASYPLPMGASQSPSPLDSPVLNQNSPHTATFRYSRAERQEALNRFREKKRRRQFRKRVRYHVRKRLAEARPRYKGRFSKPPPEDSSDDATPTPMSPHESSPCFEEEQKREHQNPQEQERCEQQPSSSKVPPAESPPVRTVIVSD